MRSGAFYLSVEFKIVSIQMCLLDLENIFFFLLAQNLHAAQPKPGTLIVRHNPVPWRAQSLSLAQLSSLPASSLFLSLTGGPPLAISFLTSFLPHLTHT
jgi:hypothetical protein